MPMKGECVLVIEFSILILAGCGGEKKIIPRVVSTESENRWYSVISETASGKYSSLQCTWNYITYLLHGAESFLRS